MSGDVNWLISEVKSENDRWRSRLHLYRLIVGGAFIMWIIYCVASIRSHSHLSPLTHLAFLMLGAIFGQEGVGLLSRPTIRHRAAILALTSSEETAVVGPLLESMHPAWIVGTHIFHSDTKLYYVVIASLTQLLPKLTETEYRTLSHGEKKALYTMLSSEYTEVALPAMEVVTRLDDTGAICILRNVAQRKTRTETAASLREATKVSLSLLQRTVGT